MAERMGSDEEDNTVLVKHIQYLSQKLESILWNDGWKMATKDFSEDLEHRSDALKMARKDLCEYLEYTAAKMDEMIRKQTEQMEREKLADQQEDEALELKHNQELQKMLDGIHQQEEYNRKLAAKAEKQEAGREELEELLKVLTKQRSEMRSRQKEVIRQGEEYESDVITIEPLTMEMWLNFSYETEKWLLEVGAIDGAQQMVFIMTRAHERFLLVLNETCEQEEEQEER